MSIGGGGGGALVQSGHIGLDHVFYNSATNRTRSRLSFPLLYTAFVASAHVSTLVEYAVDWPLKANRTVAAPRRIVIITALVVGGCGCV